MIEYSERITIDPNVCNGKPVIRGTRIAVQSVIEYLSNGDSVDDIVEHLPGITHEDVYAALAYASNLMSRNFVLEPVGA